MDYREEIRRIMNEYGRPMTIKEIQKETAAILNATVERMIRRGEIHPNGKAPNGTNYYTLIPGGPIATVRPRPMGQEAVLQAITAEGVPMTAEDIRRATGHDRPKLNGELQALRQDGLIEYDRHRHTWQRRAEP